MCVGNHPRDERTGFLLLPWATFERQSAKGWCALHVLLLLLFRWGLLGNVLTQSAEGQESGCSQLFRCWKAEQTTTRLARYHNNLGFDLTQLTFESTLPRGSGCLAGSWLKGCTTNRSTYEYNLLANQGLWLGGKIEVSVRVPMHAHRCTHITIAPSLSAALPTSLLRIVRLHSSSSSSRCARPTSKSFKSLLLASLQPVLTFFRNGASCLLLCSFLVPAVMDPTHMDGKVPMYLCRFCPRRRRSWGGA